MNENQRHDMRQTQRLRTNVAIMMSSIDAEANRLRNIDNKLTFYERKIEELEEMRETTLRNEVIQLLRTRIHRLRNPHVEHDNSRIDAMRSFHSQFRGNENRRARGKTRRRKGRKSRGKSRRRR